MIAFSAMVISEFFNILTLVIKIYLKTFFTFIIVDRSWIPFTIIFNAHLPIIIFLINTFFLKIDIFLFLIIINNKSKN